MGKVVDMACAGVVAYFRFGLRQCAGELRRLEVLDISGCKQIGDDTLTTIGKKLIPMPANFVLVGKRTMQVNSHDEDGLE